MRWRLACLCLFFLVVSAVDVPHVRECARCDSCTIGEDVEGFVKLKHERCMECRGCTHTAAWLVRNFTILDQNFQMHPGSTKSVILNVTDAGDVSWILKLRRNRHGHIQQFVEDRQHNLYAAVSTLQRMCGVEDLFTKIVRRPVRVVFGNGTVFVDDKAWLETFAPGGSAEMMLIHRSDIFEEVFPRTRSADWYRAALFDTLTLQGDRHGEQIFLTEDGKVTLIDTVHQSFSLQNGLNVIWSPGAYYFNRNLYGWDHLVNNSKPMHRHHWIQLSWDVRCTRPHDSIVTRQFDDCLSKIQTMSAGQVSNDFFQSKHFVAHARALKHQAEMIVHYGLENALRKMKHSNDSSLVPTREGFPWLQFPKCITFADQR